MQTFLPYPDFAASAAVLDQARLGKQRVETLQALRALVLPDYGWQRHPAIRMWMGYVPALSLYGRAMVEEWVSRGHADTTGPLIREFAPDADPREVLLPSWLGDAGVHLSHQSNLIQKAPEIYRDRFPGVPEDLPYLWPEPEREILPAEPAGGRVWVWRTDAVPAGEPGESEAALRMPLQAPGGRAAPKWERQLAVFEHGIADGDPVVLAGADPERFRTGTAGPVLLAEDVLLRGVVLDGWVRRGDFEHPALLQDPRTLFCVPLPRR
ncbi:hypothetical protein D6T65_09755 [Arthrobacter frigidicola]|nr:hypothetical protein D6T65_09755 [Arthrobacter frigidicola]